MRHPLFQTPPVSDTPCFRHPLFRETPPVSDTSCFRHPLFQTPPVSDTSCFRHPLFRETPPVSDTSCFRHPLFQTPPVSDTPSNVHVEFGGLENIWSKSKHRPCPRRRNPVQSHIRATLFFIQRAIRICHLRPPCFTTP